MGWTTAIPFLAGGRDFFSFHHGRGVKLIIHLHLVPRSKNEWSYASTLNTPSWRGAQLKKHRDFIYVSTSSNPTTIIMIIIVIKYS
jgi:hypothetical protein